MSVEGRTTLEEWNRSLAVNLTGTFLTCKQGRSIDELQQAVRDVHPIGRYGTPDDVANLVHWLASDEARYATGQLWVLDGGLTAQVQQMRV